MVDPASDNQKPHVGLFATCLVDLMRPVIGFAAVRLLEQAGCRVSVPMSQTCCGQPAYNAGDPKNARAIARNVIATFEEFDYVVVPSGSCAGMIKVHFPILFKDDVNLQIRAENLAARTYELSVFISDIKPVTNLNIQNVMNATYHDGCSGLRELGIKKQPRRLLRHVSGLELAEADEAEACCGFGGMFCVKYPDVSTRIVDAKIDDALKTKADVLLGGDLGCLLNIAGRLKRRGIDLKVRHLAEVLSGFDQTTPPIGDEPNKKEPS